ncbi:MAG: orotidine-5'-phosphate decarboxylase [Gammaproteobacteria bacterium]|nr:MAG: orotidine-5'-phosphate decarboxylase [Gammaproteobacteria bacterium]
MSHHKPLIIALDFASRAEAESLVGLLDPNLCRVKVGKEMFTRFGPAWVEWLQKQNFEVFLDLKFHDIPTTVAKAVRAASALGVWMVNVHASGGPRMLEAAVESLANVDEPPLLIGVTVLTSMDSSELSAVGVSRPLDEQVKALAKLCQQTGLNGVVCSAHEAQSIKATCGESFLTVTPGIRPKWAAGNDQTRIMTPSEALASGSDYLVVGRPVTASSDPKASLARLAEEISLT